MKKNLGTYDLNQSPFYKLRTKQKLANLLKLELKELDDIQGLATNYRRAWLHKKDKKRWLNIEPSAEQSKLYRPIDLPPDKLKRVQKRIESHLSRIQIGENVYSPVKGRSYVDNAAEHRFEKSTYSMDIESYFPNTTRSKILKFFQMDMKCPVDVAVIITNIVSKDDGLPQGSPCSPILAYLANQKMWEEITQEVLGADCRCTIYADDLTISGNVVPGELVHRIRRIILKHGMNVKREKDKSSYLRSRKITGVIVRDGQLLLPNEKHLKIKEAAVEMRMARNETERETATNKLRSRQAQKRQIESQNS